MYVLAVSLTDLHRFDNLTGVRDNPYGFCTTNNVRIQMASIYNSLPRLAIASRHAVRAYKNALLSMRQWRDWPSMQFFAVTLFNMDHTQGPSKKRKRYAGSYQDDWGRLFNGVIAPSKVDEHHAWCGPPPWCGRSTRSAASCSARTL